MAYSDDTRVYRLERKIVKTDGCWEWTGGRTAAGYGMFRWSTDGRVTAHRAAYRIFVGDIPPDREIDHICRNRGCVNPDHLRVVTHAENCARANTARGDMLPNGRKTHCSKGHPFAGDNLRVNRNGSRACRVCQRDAMRRYRERHS